MSAAEVIAEALPPILTIRVLRSHTEVTIGGETQRLNWGEVLTLPLPEAVLAAIRAMTPEQQAEVVRGGVQSRRLNRGGPREFRLLGPWCQLIDADVRRDHEEDER